MGVRRTRGCLGHQAVDHVKVGAVDGPSAAVVKKAQVCILSLSTHEMSQDRSEAAHKSGAKTGLNQD